VYNVTEDEYSFVENANSDFYGVKFKNDSPYRGVMVVYGTVSVKESIELDMATLSFTYNLLDSGAFDPEDLNKSDDFKNYLGDVLKHIVQDSVNEYKGNIIGNNESTTNPYTESSSE